MKTFRITEQAPTVTTWTHYVEAETEEEAIEKMMKGETIDSYSTTEEMYADAEIVNVEEVK